MPPARQGGGSPSGAAREEKWGCQAEPPARQGVPAEPPAGRGFELGKRFALA